MKLQSLSKKSFIAFIVILALALLVWVVSQFSNYKTSLPTGVAKDGPPALATLLSSNANNKVIQKWSVTDGSQNITGWLVDLSGQKQIYWSTGDFVIAGGLVDANGVNLTEQWATTLGISEADRNQPQQAGRAQRAPVAQQTYTEQDWQSLTAAKYIQLGYEQASAEKAIYVFFEPFCSACSSLLARLKPEIESKQLDVRLVPLAWISANSVPAIQAMIDGGKEAVWKHEEAKQTKAAYATATPTPETKMAIIQNSELMGTLGIQGTPTLFYRNGGEMVKVVNNFAAISQAINSLQLSASVN